MKNNFLQLSSNNFKTEIIVMGDIVFKKRSIVAFLLF